MLIKVIFNVCLRVSWNSNPHLSSSMASPRALLYLSGAHQRGGDSCLTRNSCCSLQLWLVHHPCLGHLQGRADPPLNSEFSGCDSVVCPSTSTCLQIWQWPSSLACRELLPFSYLFTLMSREKRGDRWGHNWVALTVRDTAFPFTLQLFFPATVGPGAQVGPPWKIPPSVAFYLSGTSFSFLRANFCCFPACRLFRSPRYLHFAFHSHCMVGLLGAGSSRQDLHWRLP